MKTSVFVSSTYLDLKDTREIVCDALERSKLEPVLFEKGGVGFDPEHPLDISCYKRIYECEIYILIIGSRYGSPSSKSEKLNDKGTCSFNSVTRQEWIEAKSHKIPIYIFIKQEVLSEYHIYQKQESESYRCVYVDNVNVLRLIDDIYNERVNNYIKPYQKPQEIVEAVLEQISSLLKKQLSDKRSMRSFCDKRTYFIDCYKLFYYRQKKKITQAKLASEAGCDPRWIKKVENEKHSCVFHKASINEVSAIERSLGLEPGELFGSNSLLHDSEYKGFYYASKKKKIHKDNIDKDKKIVIFDFDGTLTIQDKGHSTWEKLWIELGYDENECIDYHRKFTAGEIDHSSWCDITRDRFNDKFISQETLVNVAKSIRLMDGASELLEKLYDSGVIIYVLSGSIEFVIKEVLGDSLKFIKEISSNDMVFNEGRLSKIIGTKYDFEGKAEFIKRKILKYGVSASEVLFVGNSNNDVHAFESSAVTLLINPVKVDPYSKCWTYSEMSVDNLMSIEKYIFPNFKS